MSDTVAIAEDDLGRGRRLLAAAGRVTQFNTDRNLTQKLSILDAVLRSGLP
jgi:hypothetical protein